MGHLSILRLENVSLAPRRPTNNSCPIKNATGSENPGFGHPQDTCVHIHTFSYSPCLPILGVSSNDRLSASNIYMRSYVFPNLYFIQGPTRELIHAKGDTLGFVTMHIHFSKIYIWNNPLKYGCIHQSNVAWWLLIDARKIKHAFISYF